MNKRLQILEQLYDRSRDRLSNIVGEDASLEKEAKALNEMKQILDKDIRSAPDKSTIDAIMATARAEWPRISGQPKVAGTLSPDRKPVRHARIYALRMAVAASAVFAVVLVGIWQFGTDEVGAPGDANILAEQKATPGEAEEIDIPGRAFNAPAAFEDSDGLDEGPFLVGTDTIPSWSDPDDLHMVRRRVQNLRRTSTSLEWDDMPLEMMPAASGVAGIQQTAARRGTP